MTKVMENLMVKWLDNEIDDEDARLMIKDFDAENLRNNLKKMDDLSFTNKSIEDSWQDFLKRKM